MLDNIIAGKDLVDKYGYIFVCYYNSWVMNIYDLNF